MFSFLPNEINSSILNSLSIYNLLMIASTGNAKMRKAALTEIFQRSSNDAQIAQGRLLKKFAENPNQPPPIEKKTLYSALLYQTLAYQFIGLMVAGDIPDGKALLEDIPNDPFRLTKPRILLSTAIENLTALINGPKALSISEKATKALLSIRTYQTELKDEDINSIFSVIEFAIKNNWLSNIPVIPLVSSIANRLSNAQATFLFDEIMKKLLSPEKSKLPISTTNKFLQSIVYKLTNEQYSQLLKTAYARLKIGKKSEKEAFDILSALKNRISRKDIMSFLFLLRMEAKETPLNHNKIVTLVEILSPNLNSAEAEELVPLLQQMPLISALKSLSTLAAKLNKDVDLTNVLLLSSDTELLDKEWQSLIGRFIDAPNISTALTAQLLIKNSIVKAQGNERTLSDTLNELNSGRSGCIVHCYHQENEIIEFLTKNYLPIIKTKLSNEEVDNILGLLDKLEPVKAVEIINNMCSTRDPLLFQLATSWLIKSKYLDTSEKPKLTAISLPTEENINNIQVQLFSQIVQSLQNNLSNQATLPSYQRP